MATHTNFTRADIDRDRHKQAALGGDGKRGSDIKTNSKVDLTGLVCKLLDVRAHGLDVVDSPLDNGTQQPHASCIDLARCTKFRNNS